MDKNLPIFFLDLDPVVLFKGFGFLSPNVINKEFINYINFISNKANKKLLLTYRRYGISIWYKNRII